MLLFAVSLVALFAKTSPATKTETKPPRRQRPA
jgi:hypothetical protein